MNKAKNTKVTPQMELFETNDQVYYKSEKDNSWHGPAKVIGQDNKLVFLRQGRFIVAASMSRLKKIQEPVWEQTDPDPSQNIQADKPKRNSTICPKKQRNFSWKKWEKL